MIVALRARGSQKPALSTPSQKPIEVQTDAHRPEHP
jgi:hypothetical protein